MVKWFKNVQEIFPTWQLNTDRDSRRNKNSLPVFFVSVERWNVDRPGFDAHWRDDYGVHYLTLLRGIPHVMEHPDAWSFQLIQIAERYWRVGTPRIRMLPHSSKNAERLTKMHQCITGDQNTKLVAHFLDLCFLKFGLDCRGQNGPTWENRRALQISVMGQLQLQGSGCSLTLPKPQKGWRRSLVLQSLRRNAYSFAWMLHVSKECAFLLRLSSPNSHFW